LECLEKLEGERIVNFHGILSGVFVDKQLGGGIGMRDDKLVSNSDRHVVRDFGLEWEKFDQKELEDKELENAFDQYFHLFPFDTLGNDAVGFDMGCGSGRWAKFVAPRVGKLNLVDASPVALQQAKSNLATLPNVSFECASVEDASLEPHSQDFGYCLGVLHHLPDTAEGLRSCSKFLKPGAPFLLYLYYNFENKPRWFRALWKVSDVMRRTLSKLPFRLKAFVAEVIAVTVYWPLSRLAKALEKFGRDVTNLPLADYRDKSFYFLRTDALDRFGTRLERRFSRAEIEAMLVDSGFMDIRFSDRTPHWVALARKA
jgi:SAM-dependent methyltransferase